ncbi:MAG TPA: methyltransferase domain-containing protein [Egibacteraceae bacterium]|nr:methyltransferase domain-containing protein [Egibacteraceae bacterium]
MGQTSGFQVQGSAPEHYDRHVAVFMAPMVRALVERSGLSAGGALLDVACGTGFVARAAAPVVGPEGRLAGADVNPAMLEHARAVCAGVVPPISFHHAPAESMPFGEAEFDAVLCQQGLQFFPDVDAATAEAARVLRPGGRYAATVWTALDDSPYFVAQCQAVRALAGDDDADAFASAFSFPPDRLTGALTNAGLRDVEVETIAPVVELPPLEDFVPGHFGAIPWGGTIAEQPDGLATATRMIAEALGDRVRADGSVAVPFGVLVVSGTR